MNIVTRKQIAKLLTKMVEQNAPDKELADVIEFSKYCISWKNGLKNILHERGLDKYFDNSTPSIQETVEVILDLIELPYRVEELEDVLYFSANLIVFYKELGKCYTAKNIEQYVHQYINNSTREDEDHNEYPEIENWYAII